MLFESFGCELLGLGNRVQAVPGSCIMVSSCWDYHGSHDGGDVEVRPCEHFTESYVNVEVVSYILYSVFHRDSSLVIDGFRFVSVVVGLDKEPSLVGKFIISID